MRTLVKRISNFLTAYERTTAHVTVWYYMTLTVIVEIVIALDITGAIRPLGAL